MQLTLPSSSKETKSRDVARAEPPVPALLEFQSPSQAILDIPIPASARATTWIITSMWALFIAVIAFFPVDVTVTATGKIATIDNPIVISALETTVLRQIYVNTNQVVRKGDLLARLDPTNPQSDRSALEAQVATLVAQTDREQAELNKKPYTYVGLDPNKMLQAALYAQRQSQYTFTVDDYNQKIAADMALVSRSLSDADGYKERLNYAHDMEVMRKELERLQVGSRLNTLQAEDYRAEMQRYLDNALQTAENAKATLASDRAARDAWIGQWFSDLSQKLSDDATTLSNAQEALKKAVMRTTMIDLRADQDATVLNVAKISPGTVLNPGDEFITLVPLNATLEVQAFLSGTDQGWAKVGDPVTIKLQTFPFSRYGTAAGTVRYVSPDSFSAPSNSMVGAGLGSQPQSLATPIQSTVQSISPPVVAPNAYPTFLVRISIDQLNLRHLPNEFRLLPGMPVEADIGIGQRTVLEYLLDRVMPLALDSMHEP